MTIFDDFQALADDLLAELAAPATLRRVTRVYNPITRETAEQPADYAGRGVLLPPPGLVERNAGGAVEEMQGAILGSLPAGIAPSVDDRLLIGPTLFRVNGVTPVRPDGSAILWRLALEAA